MTVPVVNVIYIRGAVTALARFAPLLTRHTPWRYRLVANGCTRSETALLHRIAGPDSRLEVHDLHASEVLPHGKALCQLASTFAGEEFFAVMDSDIALTGDITGTLGPLLETSDAVFAGTPVWAQPGDLTLPDSAREICGPHLYTRDGLLLGNSYTAVFRRDALDEAARRCRATIGRYTRPDLDSLEPGFLAFLASRDLLRDDYTPPKILALALAHAGRPAAYADCPGLHHIGGFSLAVYQQQITDGTLTADPGTTAEILDFTDDRSHMARKLAVCRRVTASFAAIDATGRPRRDTALPPGTEEHVRLLEDLYAAQAHIIAR